MHVSNRTVRSLVIIGVVLIAAWGIAQYSSAKRTTRYLSDLSLQDPGKVMDALAELRSRGASIGPRLAAIVQAQTPEAAPRAAWLLGMVGSHAGDQALQGALTSSDQALRLAAIEALGELKAAAAEPAITALLNDGEEKPAIRIAAVQALGMMGTDTAAAALAGALGARPGEESAAAAPAEARPAPAAPSTGAPAAAAPAAAAPAPAVVDAPTVRLAAAKALGMMRNPAGLDALAKTLEPKVEADVEVRVAAAYALGDVVARAEGEVAVTKGVNALLEGLKDDIGDVRIASVYSLGKVRVPETMKSTVAGAVDTAQSDKHYWARLAAAQTARSLGLPKAE